MNGNTIKEPFSYIENIESIRNDQELVSESKQEIESTLDLKGSSFSYSASFLEKESGCIEDCSIKLTAHIPTENKKLQGTRYFFEEKKVIHFTSINALYSIINDGAIRLYNLHNSNDDSEYSFAANQLREIYKLQGFEEEKINKYIKTIKEYSFILSLTSPNELKNRKFWDKYGHNGKGVAIEFEIVNDLNELECFYYSKVHYDNIKEFELLRERWKKLQLKNSHIRYNINLNQLLCLHKSKGWSEEKEIRLLTLYPEIFHIEPFKERIYSDFKYDKADKPIKYFKLPLCDKNGKFIEKELNSRLEYFWEKIPKLRISNIYFSSDCPISNNDFTSFQVDLQKDISDKMNCWIGSLPNKKIEYEKQS